MMLLKHLWIQEIYRKEKEENSAMGQQQMVIEAIQAGARGFIVKPFNGEKVITEIKKIIG